MKRSILKFDKLSENSYHTVFKNNHSRNIYIQVSLENSIITIMDCFYIDRPFSSNHKSIPKKLHTSICDKGHLLNVIASELDKKFYGLVFSDEQTELSCEDYISSALSSKRKYKFLIMVSEDNILKTRIKNRVHRSIHLEIEKVDNRKGLISVCHYYDRHYKRNNTLITPSGLNTIFFDYSPKNILNIVNTELNCDFTDIIITNDTFDFDKVSLPICGSI